MAHAVREHDALIPLGDYAVPESPAHDLLARTKERLVRLIRQQGDSAVQDDRLRRASQSVLEDYIAIPDCSIVLDELEAAFRARLADGSSTVRLHVVVLPPCDRRHLMRTLAERLSLDALAPPQRATLTDGREFVLPPLDGDEPLVIPELERWFVRAQGGLDTVRRLLAAIAAGDRPCVIGVNAWAWRYLAEVADADLLLPAPLTFHPFDAERLADWLHGLKDAEGTESITLRSIDGGENVFDRDDDETLVDDYLRELAARSRGIPWVAWQRWRRGLRRVPESDDEGSNRSDDVASSEENDALERRARDDASTLWVTHDAAPLLPEGHERHALLVLQALLMHGDLDLAALTEVLPEAVPCEALTHALERAGLIACEPTRLAAGVPSPVCREERAVLPTWYVLPSAYPTVRSRLGEAGYVLGDL